MQDLFRKEIPKARINITLDIETNGAKEKRELPLKILILGDFSNNQSRVPIGLREKLMVNRQNINAVLSAVRPTLHIPMMVGHGVKKKIDTAPLTFLNFEDFQPESIVNNIPELKHLLLMRYLLKELKSTLLEDQSVREALTALLSHPEFIKKLKKDLCVRVKNKEIFNVL